MSSESSSTRKCFGIVVSGGPAPGINSVISSSVIEANNRGYVVKGLVNGFRDITMGEPNAVINLSSDMVSNIYNKGGSILGTSRFNPLKDSEHLDKFLSPSPRDCGRSRSKNDRQRPYPSEQTSKLRL